MPPGRGRIDGSNERGQLACTAANRPCLALLRASCCDSKAWSEPLSAMAFLTSANVEIICIVCPNPSLGPFATGFDSLGFLTRSCHCLPFHHHWPPGDTTRPVGLNR